MKEAISKFFTDKTDDNYDLNSDLSEWEERHLTEVSKNILIFSLRVLEVGH